MFSNFKKNKIISIKRGKLFMVISLTQAVNHMVVKRQHVVSKIFGS